ncbi:MAG TPA: GNAT family N-acetyltransferase [Thermoleophilaceae bacterium]|nr:GNAT family N-acetyltransferase [Thermoleophilaceae bacterium]
MVTIRRGNLEDLPAVLALLDEAVAWLVERGQTGQWGTEPWSERADASGRIRAMIAEGELWLAEKEGEPVGALIVGERPRHVHPVDRPELYVNLLVTSRRHAGEGIGTRLIATAVERANDEGVDLLRVDCWAGSPKLVGWYESQGFTRRGTFELRGWRGQVFEMELRPKPPPPPTGFFDEEPEPSHRP